MKHKNFILPALTNSKEDIECPYNITDFLPTNEDWLAFVKCLAEDNVEDLKAFSRHINWKNFLRSRDTDSVWLQCSPEFNSTVSMCDNLHPFPTNPFFVALFYNAQKCLMYMKESGIDFSSIVEYGYNAYHNLLGAISFTSKSRFGTSSEESIFKLVCLFHRVLFTYDQQIVMLKARCILGMTPLTWGVYIGLANYVEYIMYYYSPNSLMKSEAVGVTEHITLDVSEFVGENPCYFSSPTSALLDLYGESTLPELKKLGIFRNDFIWKQWCDLLYESNKYFIYGILFTGLVLTISTIAFTGGNVNDYLKFKCAGANANIPIGTLLVLCAWVALSAIGILFVVYGVARKEYIRHKLSYPKWPRRYYRDLLTWCIPNLVSFPAATILLWIYLDAERTCGLFGHFIYTASGLCNIILLLSSVCLIVCYLRLLPPLTTLMSSFYNSLSAFAFFIILYLALMTIFARMFQSNFIFSSSSNSTTSRSDTFPQFLTAFYETFLVSLNIVNATIFVPKDDRIDLNVTHMFYILFVPILFINFVIGILSSVVAQVQEHDIENRYIIMLSAADYAERSLAIFRKLLCKRRSIVLKICEPLTPQSKLIMSSSNKGLAAKIASLSDPNYRQE